MEECPHTLDFNPLVSARGFFYTGALAKPIVLDPPPSFWGAVVPTLP
jgi:hypothetical protein